MVRLVAAKAGVKVTAQGNIYVAVRVSKVKTVTREMSSMHAAAVTADSRFVERNALSNGGCRPIYGTLEYCYSWNPPAMELITIPPQFHGFSFYR